MGTAFKEFMRCLPNSRFWTNSASRSTSGCFITPKRVKCGNASTISVVVRGRSRRKSRIARRVGSESAFQTGSSLSGTPAARSGTPLLAVFLQPGKHVAPALAYSFAVLGIDHAATAVTESDFLTFSRRLDLDFHLVGRGIGHEHRPAQCEQRGMFDHLHKSPQVSDTVAAVAVPAPAGFRFQVQLQRLAVRRGIAFSEAMQHRLEHLVGSGLDVYVLFNVEREVVQLHGY